VILNRLSEPIVLAPLAGGASTPELTAAVSEAGGFGFLAAGYLTAEALEARIEAVRELTNRPFGVNLFVPGNPDADGEELDAYLTTLAGEAQSYGAELGDPRFDDDEYSAKLALLGKLRPEVASFAFGCPNVAEIASLKERGMEAWVTVTSIGEAQAAVEAGADVLVVQGSEAGGHRASFADDDDEPLSTLVLLRLVASEVELPLVAAGGLTDGPAVAAALAGGAAAAQVGTAFLRADEAGTDPAHRNALPSSTPTALTRAFSGRRARGIVNRFLSDHTEAAPSAYPQIHHATSPMRAAARKRGDADGFNLWAGQAHQLAPSGPAAKIVRDLAEGARQALEAASRRVR
jgi:nitronate monooxygenase